VRRDKGPRTLGRAAQVEDDNLDSADSKRVHILAETADTYARYAASGYGTRWSPVPGVFDPMGDEREAILVEAIGDVSSGMIVDLGCGGGHLALTLERRIGRPARYVGVDLLDDRIADARQRVPWGEFHVASGDRLPLADESVDVLVAATVFSSIPDAWFRGEIAREIGRVLRPHGRVVVYDIRYPSPGNPAVRPIRRKTLQEMFPGWAIATQTVTLLPPLARSPIGRGRRRYRALARIPFLRSHLLAVITRA
jgi:ubiquinone/menaquinone biosynthesis C-methylase UbiE